MAQHDSGEGAFNVKEECTYYLCPLPGILNELVDIMQGVHHSSSRVAPEMVAQKEPQGLSYLDQVFHYSCGQHFCHRVEAGDWLMHTWHCVVGLSGFLRTTITESFQWLGQAPRLMDTQYRGPR